MANGVFNIAKGKAGQLIQNVKDANPANSRLIVVPIETAGIVADATMLDYTTLAALLAGASNEQVTMGRKTVVAASITPAVDNANDRLDVDMLDIVWAAAAGNAISALVVCYAPDGVTPGADSTLIPLSKHDFVVTPDGSDVTAVINAAGFYRAAGV